jgi:hypothetical protein
VSHAAADDMVERLHSHIRLSNHAIRFMGPPAGSPPVRGPRLQFRQAWRLAPSGPLRIDVWQMRRR